MGAGVGEEEEYEEGEEDEEESKTWDGERRGEPADIGSNISQKVTFERHCQHIGLGAVGKKRIGDHSVNVISGHSQVRLKTAIGALMTLCSIGQARSEYLAERWEDSKDGVVAVEGVTMTMDWTMTKWLAFLLFAVYIAAVVWTTFGCRKSWKKRRREST